MTKNTLIFQTGHGKGLARAEILSIFENTITDEVFDGFVVETQISDPIQTINRMGGIVRICQILQSAPANMPINFEEWVRKAAEEEIKDKSGKNKYGLSMHPKSEKILKKTLMNTKRNLKKSLQSIRFVNKNFQNLSSVQAWHEKLLEDNAVELHLFKSRDKWYLAKTIAIQNFEWYSHRDYDRPAKSAKVGMFPPKLAQILINISGANYLVYDPFCGSGTVLQEAWLMGLQAWGSDIEEQMIKDSKKNLEWLKETFNSMNIVGLENFPHLFQADATKLKEKDLPEVDFTIVTETWLGPRLTKPPSQLELPKIQREVEELYEDFFANLKSIIKKPVTVVFTAPFHKEKNDRHFLPNLPEILNKYSEIIPLSSHKRPSLFYERKQQIVGREIWKLIVKP